MPRGKKKTTKSIKDTEKELTKDIEKEQEEIIEPVTFQYVGNLTKTTTLVGIIEKDVPFTVSDANQINHFRNLNTFEELPKGYKIEKKEDYEIPDDFSSKDTMVASETTLKKDWDDSSNDDLIEESKRDEMVEE